MSDYSQQIIDSAVDIITPVFEGAIITAGEYATACGRDCVTSTDMRYAMRYAAMTMVGARTGSMFPDLYDADSDSDEEDGDGDEEDEINFFTRYDGTDEKMNAINTAYDTWSTWIPYSPIEKMLKNAVDNN